MRIADVDILIVPGLGGAGDGHWQRRWGARLSTGRLIEREHPDEADPDVWIIGIEREIMLATRPVVLVAHGLAVSAVVHAAQHLKDSKVRGAFLVAPVDDERADLTAAARAFGPLPRDPLPFPSMLIASSNDPACSVERAADLATCWGSDFHLAGEAGPIDLESGHGPWPEGLVMFTRLMQRLR